MRAAACARGAGRARVHEDSVGHVNHNEPQPPLRQRARQPRARAHHTRPQGPTHSTPNPTGAAAVTPGGAPAARPLRAWRRAAGGVRRSRTARARGLGPPHGHGRRPLEGADAGLARRCGLRAWVELRSRRPRSLLRLPGELLLRLATRAFCGSLFQLPPRLTRLDPDAGQGARRRRPPNLAREAAQGAGATAGPARRRSRR